MKKSIVVTIYVDDVPLSELETIQETIDELLADYDSKRVTVQIQDERLVRL